MRGGIAPWSVPALVAIILLVTLVFVAAMFFGLTALFAFGGGWHALAERYPARLDPKSEACQRKTIRVGAVRYRQGATVCVLQQGLYIRTRLPFHHPMLIPWAAFANARETAIHGKAGVQFDVDTPRIATLSVERPLFEQLKAHLSASLTDSR